jgi:hypothetical protein
MPVPTPKTWEEVPSAVWQILEEPFTKKADGLPIVSPMADVLGWRAGEANAHWGGPRPLTNLIVGSALGSLGGYGVGRLAEQFLPEKYFDPKAVRRRAMLVGGAMGAAPALWQAYDNNQSGSEGLEAFTDSWPRPMEKPSADMWGREGEDMFEPVIHRDNFNAAVWADPYTHPRYQAATAGIVDAASITRGGSDFVSPWDIARIAVGAGVGYASGVVAGKALGYLAGLSAEGQEKAQQIGLWSGIIKSVVPIILGKSR